MTAGTAYDRLIRRRHISLACALISVVAAAALSSRSVWECLLVLLAGAANFVIWVNRPRPSVSAPRRPKIVLAPDAHRTPPVCVSCQLEDVDVSEDPFGFQPIIEMGFGYSFGERRTPYQQHRDCWVASGNENELERMLRHVTWSQS